MAVAVAGEACKAGKEFDRWYGRAVIERGAWKAWLRSKDWSGLGKVVMNDTHESGVRGWLASTVNETLRFETKTVGSEEWLAYEAEIDDGDNMTQAQSDVVGLLRQKMTPDVSLGYIIFEYDWELARDPDNDRDEDTMVQTKIAPWEVAVVTWGAQGDDGNVALAEAQSAIRLVDDRLVLQSGPMREYQRAGDEVVPFDAAASKKAAERALDEKLAARDAKLVPSDHIDRLLAIDPRRAAR